MGAIAEAAADVLDYSGDARAPPGLRENNVAKERCRHRQRHQENSDYPLAVGETGAAREGPDREAGHEGSHSRNPPLDAVPTFEKIRADPHEAHEEGADPCHQEQVADQHDVVYGLY